MNLDGSVMRSPSHKALPSVVPFIYEEAAHVFKVTRAWNSN